MQIRSLLVGCGMLAVAGASAFGQARDFQAERLIVDDNSGNRITLQTSAGPITGGTLTIPDPAGASAFLIANPSGGTQSVWGDLLPGTDNTYNLGSGALRWGDIYLGGALNLGFTPGSVVFADGSGNMAENNAAFFWDNTNSRLGIGTDIPDDALDVVGDIQATGTIQSGLSIIIDGTTATRTITSDAAMEIGTTAGDLTIDAAGGTTTVDDALNVNGTITSVGGGSDIVSGDDVVVTDDIQMTGLLSAIENTATGIVIVDDNLTVNGAALINGAVTATGNITTTANVTATGSVTATNDVTALDDIIVTDDLILATPGSTISNLLSGTVTVDDGLAVTGSATVDGNTTLGNNAGSDATTINGTTTINQTGAGPGLVINESGSDNGLTITEADGGDGLSITANGGGRGMDIDHQGASGMGARIRITNAANPDHALQVSTSGAGNAINVNNGDVLINDNLTVNSDADLNGEVRIGGGTAVTNSRLVVDDGHWTSQQTTAPAAAAAGANVTSAVLSNATDVAGVLDITSSGAPLAGAQATVTFDSPYATAPVVLVMPANGPAAGVGAYITRTTTGFTVNFIGVPAAATSHLFHYMVIETQ